MTARPKINLTRLVRPTLETKFHIDYEWWTRQDRDMDVFLRGLCDGHNITFDDGTDPEEIVDWVDPVTGEVQPVNLMSYYVRTRVAKSPDFITPNTALIEAVFRVFVANGNRPLTVPELLVELGRTGQESQLLRALSSPKVLRGIRPYIEA